MNVLLTGANGFIGAWTLRRLLAAGHTISVLDLLSAGTLVQRLVGTGLQQVNWHTGDITRPQDIETAARDCTAFVHLAGVLTPFCQEDPLQGAHVNLAGALHVFEAARRVDQARVVYASSAGVFGPEQADYPEPQTHYGAFKLAVEGCARAYWRDHGVASVGLRPYVVYGPGRDVGASAGVSLACRAAKEGRTYTIPFTGRAGMVYVEDVVDAIVAAIGQPAHGAHLLDLFGEVHDVAAVIAAIRSQVPGAQLDAAGSPLPHCPDRPIPPGAPVLPGLHVTSLRDGIAATLAFAGE